MAMYTCHNLVTKDKREVEDAGSIGRYQSQMWAIWIL